MKNERPPSFLKRRRLLTALTALPLALLLAAGTTALQASADKGKTLYATCAACHGQNGEGNKALNSPAIAGQSNWYLVAQLKKFKEGQRGTHKKDVYGAQMKPMAMLLATDADVQAVADYVSAMTPTKHKPTLGGDAAKGKALYATCAACHGQDGKGMEALNSPSLLNQHDWYLLTQLKHFKGGVRGAAKGDATGAQMMPMASLLADEQAMKDVIAYIDSMQ